MMKHLIEEIKNHYKMVQIIEKEELSNFEKADMINTTKKAIMRLEEQILDSVLVFKEFDGSEKIDPIKDYITNGGSHIIGLKETHPEWESTSYRELYEGYFDFEPEMKGWMSSAFKWVTLLDSQLLK